MKTLLILLAAASLAFGQLVSIPPGDIVLDPASWVFPPGVTTQPTVPWAPGTFWPDVERDPVGFFLLPILKFLDGPTFWDVIEFRLYWSPFEVAQIGIPTFDSATGLASPSDFHPNHGLTFSFMMTAPLTTGLVGVSADIGNGLLPVGPLMTSASVVLQQQVSPGLGAGWNPTCCLFPPPIAPTFGTVEHVSNLIGYPNGLWQQISGFSFLVQTLFIAPNALGDYAMFLSLPVVVSI